MTEIHQQQLAGRVGRAISKQRTRCGLTQEEVAERLGVGNEAVSRIERGVVVPNIARLLEFAAIFNCEAAELLTEVSPRPDDQAIRISQLLKPLSHDDRQLIVDLVERLTKRLGNA
ncbi:Helix-turn-helix [Pseudomonas syringae]|uniref:helix-turn-helix domain-containing protein n=1 Tax=Pseudomonas syringae TaxID=317 RepID=UPI0008F2CC17|nr:helix-turn-helix transcriptional regulator [Pseudomonas syringae]SFI22746.1 Helix-turn-helix [Pseudomonas syringae]